MSVRGSTAGVAAVVAGVALVAGTLTTVHAEEDDEPGSVETAAVDVPETLTHQGRLLDDDEPVVGDVELTYTIWDDPVDGSVLWQDVIEVEADDSGFYSVELGGADNPVDPVVLQDGQGWMGVAIGDDEEMEPRISLNSVPYALVAEEALRATDAEWADEAGSAESAAEADYAAEAGSAQTADHAQTSDEAESVEDGSIETASLADGFEVELEHVEAAIGQTLGQMSCVDGEVARFDGSEWNCRETVGHAETATEADHAESADTALQADEADHAETSDEADYADEAGQADEADYAEMAGAIETQTLGGLTCVDGEIAQYDGSNWTCDDTVEHAESAAMADEASYADQAGQADQADHADIADEADFADEAGQADHALEADEADHAQVADEADFADEAGQADHALEADEADHALGADEADHALEADEADHALEADEADYAEVAGEVETQTVGGLSCADGEIARYDGTNWTCDDTVEHAESAAMADEAGQADEADFAQIAAGVEDGSIESDDLSSSFTVSPDQVEGEILGGLSCVSGEVPRFDGNNWYCDDSVDDGVQQVTATGPVESSGGDEPNISMAVADEETDGYLAADDYASFDGRVESVQGGQAVAMSGTQTSPQVNVEFGDQAGTAVEGDDPRLSDAREPLPGSDDYIQNDPTSTQQASFDIDGEGLVGQSVGIGTTDPDEELHVAGDAYIEGDLEVDGDFGFGDCPAGMEPVSGGRFCISNDQINPDDNADAFQTCADDYNGAAPCELHHYMQACAQGLDVGESTNTWAPAHTFYNANDGEFYVIDWHGGACDWDNMDTHGGRHDRETWGGAVNCCFG